MKKRKNIKFDKEKSERDYDEILNLLEDENIKKLRKESLPNFIKKMSDKTEIKLKVNSIIRVYDDLKTGVI